MAALYEIRTSVSLAWGNAVVIFACIVLAKPLYLLCVCCVDHENNKMLSNFESVAINVQ